MNEQSLTRQSLDESLEAYARRNRRTVDESRLPWRIEALRLLHVHPGTGDAIEVLSIASAGLCRIAPGVAVPTNAVTWSDEP